MMMMLYASCLSDPMKHAAQPSLALLLMTRHTLSLGGGCLTLGVVCLYLERCFTLHCTWIIYFSSTLWGFVKCGGSRSTGQLQQLWDTNCMNMQNTAIVCAWSLPFSLQREQLYWPWYTNVTYRTRKRHTDHMRHDRSVSKCSGYNTWCNDQACWTSLFSLPDYYDHFPSHPVVFCSCSARPLAEITIARA